ncbi:GT-D fold domain-containing glycosyltransferase [Streptococcus sp. A34]|uniref:GT-D fold domain-containing glycosyltransferase n=1 Tax=Streptococcus sp. A34 TaxID=3373130 RepID=UPI00374DCABC
MSVLINIRSKLLKNSIGKKIFLFYHYLFAVPYSKFKLLRYYLKRNNKDFKNLRNVRFFTNDELFEKLIKEKKSLVRFGDGEISWIYQKSKGYFGQENSKELSDKLKYILTTPTEKTILAIPNFFGKFEGYSKSRIESKNIHLGKFADKWLKLLDLDYIYGDALVTRVYNGRFGIDFSNEFSKWKNVWKDRDIVIVEGEGTKFGVGNDLLAGASTIKRIIAPSENAFSKYNTILECVLELKNDALVLIALGPTATILAYELTENYNFQAIDIGHLDIEYEWFLNNSKKASPVKGKYVNEAGGMSLEELDVESLTSYNDEIIIRI